MGITEERIERIKKHAETMEGFARAAASVSSELDAVLQDNQQMERQIERLNEANDRLRERLNRGENHEAYLKLPVDADGAAIHVGDAVYFESEVAKVCGMRWDGASWSLSLHDRAEHTTSHRCRLVPTAALIGADGVSIGVGDIVYRDAGPEPLQVDLIYAGSMGYCTVRLKDSAGIYTSADAHRLSHEKPEPADSWEKLEEDAEKDACELAGKGGSDDCVGCKWFPRSNCNEMARIEILKRAKKLAGIEEAQR